MGRTSAARQHLIDAAADLLWNESYGAVGVDRLCRAAGVRKGSFYHFFASKDDLVLATIDQRWAGVRELFEDAVGREGPALERLLAIFEALHGYYADVQATTGRVPGCPFGNLAVELGTTHERLRQHIHEVFEATRAYFRQLLEEGRRAGELPLAAAEVEAVSDMLLAYVQGGLLLAKTRNDPRVIRDLAPGAAAIARGGGATGHA